MLNFTKMQGCGNDYIYIDCFKQTVKDPAALAIKLSPRRFSIGADGVILICPSDRADAKMRMFNADGSEGRMCGNGIRCVGKYLYDNGIARKDVITVDTLSGVKTLTVHAENGVATALSVDMGRAETAPEALPVLADAPVINGVIEVGGREYTATCVSMGNPHCVVFRDDVEELDIKAEGEQFEKSPLFPESVNTEFVKVLGRRELKMRVWERGSGETFACGTGACAAAVAAVLCGYCDKGEDVTVHLLGGDLVINYTDERVIMTGPAVKVCEGVVEE
ncbi:MAG: diaminopimelate epimerase [Clostridia bacterium]|nr:diaminopimelate epimerase [Clostridia bacterium]